MDGHSLHATRDEFLSRRAVEYVDRMLTNTLLAPRLALTICLPARSPTSVLRRRRTEVPRLAAFYRSTPMPSHHYAFTPRDVYRRQSIIVRCSQHHSRIVSSLAADMLLICHRVSIIGAAFSMPLGRELLRSRHVSDSRNAGFMLVIWRSRPISPGLRLGAPSGLITRHAT